MKGKNFMYLSTLNYTVVTEGKISVVPELNPSYSYIISYTTYIKAIHTVLLIHQPGSLSGACINRPETGKSTPQELLLNLLYSGYVPNTVRQGQFLVTTLISPALWNLNVTYPYLSQVPSCRREKECTCREQVISLAQALTSG